jgi:hypothetical protein
MLRKCDNPKCRKPYQAILPTSRFCSDRCRAQNKGAPKPERARQREFYVPDDPDTDPVHILQQRRQARIDGDDQALAYWMARWNALPPSVTNPNADRW